MRGRRRRGYGWRRRRRLRSGDRAGSKRGHRWRACWRGRRNGLRRHGLRCRRWRGCSRKGRCFNGRGVDGFDLSAGGLFDMLLLCKHGIRQRHGVVEIDNFDRHAGGRRHEIARAKGHQRQQGQQSEMQDERDKGRQTRIHGASFWSLGRRESERKATFGKPAAPTSATICMTVP